MSRIPGFVLGPAPQVYCVQQPLPYTQVVQQPVNTVYIPQTHGPRVIVGHPNRVVYASPAPNRSVIYVNRTQPGQLSVIGGRLGSSIGTIVESALGPPPPHVTMYHQYNAPPQQNQSHFVQYPCPPPPAYSVQQQECPDYTSKPAAKPH